MENLHKLEDKFYKDLVDNKEKLFVDILREVDLSNVSLTKEETEYIDFNCEVVEKGIENNVFSERFVSVYNEIKHSNYRIFLLSEYVYSAISIETTSTDLDNKQAIDEKLALDWFFDKYLKIETPSSDAERELFLIRAISIFILRHDKKYFNDVDDIKELQKYFKFEITEDSVEIRFYTYYSFSCGFTYEKYENEVLRSLTEFVVYQYALENNINI